MWGIPSWSWLTSKSREQFRNLCFMTQAVWMRNNLEDGTADAETSGRHSSKWGLSLKGSPACFYLFLSNLISFTNCLGYCSINAGIEPSKNWWENIYVLVCSLVRRNRWRHDKLKSHVITLQCKWCVNHRCNNKIITQKRIVLLLVLVVFPTEKKNKCHYSHFYGYLEFVVISMTSFTWPGKSVLLVTWIKNSKKRILDLLERFS
jgi:hypothetical protein